MDHVIISGLALDFQAKKRQSVTLLLLKPFIVITHLGKANETAKFCKMMNGSFDCANARSTTEYLRKHNDFLAPYLSTSDERFKWLEDTFIKYLDNWKAAVDPRKGKYTP